ncbi:TPA: hypothetical protein N0F65_008804 [Lagenidium giganteum]|uniref:PH domain-containing protein n=1 Tax=Lagenidium giganteum TaxID=4803 RepID=A0AAV2YZT5_9STRA|nr:TPA: hypothetical protein N0F65_008804 [Lagenidium giganteum]
MVDPGEFTVAWLTFKGDATVTEDRRFLAKKEGLLSSKLLRGLFGEFTMKCFEECEGDTISRESFICLLSLCYEGNTEDRISYIFSMYSIVHSNERNHKEGFISEKDYVQLLDHLETFNFIPKKFYAAFEECMVPIGGMLTNTQFVEWVRQYPTLTDFLANHLPPSAKPTSPIAIRTSDDFTASVDALNNSPSFRNDKGKAHFSSFDCIGGEDSGEDSDELYDSDQISEMEEPFDEPFQSSAGRDAHYANRNSTGDRSDSSEGGEPSESSSRRRHEGQGGPLPPDVASATSRRTTSRTRGVQKMGRNIGKAVGGGISKVGYVGRSILHVGKSHHSNDKNQHRPNHNEMDSAAASLVAAGYAFSSESQISKNYVCGYLHKISDGKWSKRSWHRRWFVLDRQQGVLSYYRYNPANHISPSPRGNIVHMDGEQVEGLPGQERPTSVNSGLRVPTDTNGHVGEGGEGVDSEKNNGLLYLNKSHPWYRGEIDLNLESVSLLFEKSLAKSSPTRFFFQVSTLSLSEIDSKRGVQYKLCADNDVEFDQWTHAIAEAINRKHEQAAPEAPVVSHQQLYRQRLLEEKEKAKESVQQSQAPLSERSNPPKSTGVEDTKPPKSTKQPVSQTSTAAPKQKVIPPPIVTYAPPPVITPEWKLAITIEGKKQCLIACFVVNIVTVKCLASEHVLWKCFVCVLVTVALIMKVRDPHPPRPPRYVDGHRPSPAQSRHIDAAVLNTDVPSTCENPDSCCMHRPPPPTEHHAAGDASDQSKGSDTASTQAFGQTNFNKFGLGDSMKQTESIPSGKSSGNSHRWAHTTAETFSVRSLEYKKTRRKEASKPALFEFIGADLVKADTKIDLISQRVELPEKYANDRLFIINAQLPSYGPSVWGDANSDGPGFSLILFWRIPTEICDELRNPTRPVTRLLKRFLEAGNDTSLTDRFKVIAQVTNQDECGITGMAKKLLVSHNATPVLTRPQHRIYHFQNGTTEIVVDIHTFSYIARRGIHLLLDKTTNLVIDIGFVLQGETEDELPEQLLGCCRLDRIAMQELNEIKNEYDLKNKRQNSAPVLVEAGRVRVGTANSVADSQSRGNEPPAKTPSDQPQQVTAPVDTNRDLASPRQRLQVAEMVMRKLYKRNLETEKEVASWKAKFEALEKQRQETSAVPESNRLVRSAESHVCHVCEERARQAQVLVLTPPPTAATLARIDNQQLEYLRHLAAEQDKTITALKIRIEELSNQITQNHSNEGRSGSKDRVAGGKKSSKGTVTPRQALSRLQTKLNEALSESERQKNNYLKMKRDFQHLMAVKTKSLCENPSLLHANARELIQLMEKKLQQLDNEQAVSASLYNSKLYEVEQQTCDSYVQKRLVEEELQRVARDVQARDAVDVQIEQCMMGVFERLHQVEVENMQLKQLSAQTLRATTVPLNDVASKQPQQ